MCNHEVALDISTTKETNGAVVKEDDKISQAELTTQEDNKTQVHDNRKCYECEGQFGPHHLKSYPAMDKFCVNCAKEDILQNVSDPQT